MTTTSPTAIDRREREVLADIDDCLDARVVARWYADGRLGTAPGRGDASNGVGDPAAVTIDRVRRSASRGRNPSPLSLCYTIEDGRDAPVDPMAKVWLARLVRREQSRAPQDSPACSSTVSSTASSADPRPAPCATIALRAADLLVWRWPHDPVLTQLRALLDGSAARFVSASPVVSVETLKWEPEHRATLRVRFRAHEGARDEIRYAKTFAGESADDRGAAIHERFEHFWRQALDRNDMPRVARPLGYDPATATVWQAQASGEPLVDVLRQHDGWARGRTRPCDGLAASVARAIAAIHRAPIGLAGSGTASPARDSCHWAGEIVRRRRKLGRVRAAIAEPAARLADALLIAVQRDPAGAFGEGRLIHGDCHPEQLWVDHDRIVWFDFDEFCRGEPMEDLAQFVTKLEQSGIAPPFGEAVVDAYAAVMPGAFDGRRLAWHRALQHLLQASRAYVYQRADWPRLALAHLAEGHRRLGAWQAS